MKIEIDDKELEDTLPIIIYFNTDVGCVIAHNGSYPTSESGLNEIERIIENILTDFDGGAYENGELHKPVLDEDKRLSEQEYVTKELSEALSHAKMVKKRITKFIENWCNHHIAILEKKYNKVINGR